MGAMNAEAMYGAQTSGFRKEARKADALQRNARIVQLVFLQLSQETEGYRGAYQGENI